MGIESTYRAAMRAYPSTWREEHERAALGILLDSADAEGRTSADWRQLADLLRSGMAARLDRLLPRHRRDLAATAVLIGTTGFALLDLFFFEWQPWARGLDLHPERYWFYGPFTSVAVWALIPWIVGFALQLAHLTRLARIAFAASGAAAAVLAWLGMHAHSSVAWHFHDMATPDTLAVFIIGSPVVLAGRADRVLRSWPLLTSALAAFTVIAVLWQQRTGHHLVALSSRRMDDALWNNWVANSAGGDHTVDPWLFMFFIVMAALIGLRARRVAETLMAVLGPLSLVAAFWFLWRHGWIMWGRGWWGRDGVHEVAALATIGCALVAARIVAVVFSPVIARSPGSRFTAVAPVKRPAGGAA